MVTTNVHASEVVFRGIYRSSAVTKECSDSAGKEHFVMVLNDTPEKATTGVYYSDESLPGTLHRLGAGVFEMHDPLVESKKLKPSLMYITSHNSRLKVRIKEFPPENPDITEGYCWLHIPVFSVRKAIESPAKHKFKAKLTFNIESEFIIIHDLIYVQNDYASARERSKILLQTTEKEFGKSNKYTLNALGVLLISIMQQDRFDEALEEIEPFCKALPRNNDLKDFKNKLLELKKEQDNLFRYEPSKDDEIELEPFASLTGLRQVCQTGRRNSSPKEPTKYNNSLSRSSMSFFSHDNPEHILVRSACYAHLNDQSGVTSPDNIRNSPRRSASHRDPPQSPGPPGNAGSAGRG